MVEVSPAQKVKLEALRKRFDITIIVAFGSRVKGITHARSDLDIGILCAKGFDAEILGELSGEERDLQEFRMYAFRRYVEHRPFFGLEERVNARHLAGA